MLQVLTFPESSLVQSRTVVPRQSLVLRLGRPSRLYHLLRAKKTRLVVLVSSLEPFLVQQPRRKLLAAWTIETMSALVRDWLSGALLGPSKPVYS